MPRWINENRWDGPIHTASVNYGVPMALIKAIIGQESQYNPAVSRGEVAIGDASIGLMQILYGTAKGEGYSGPIGSPTGLTGLFDPATNIVYGTSFLSKMLRRSSTVSGAISAYNGGYRPELGFGEPVTRVTTVCLRKDKYGKCVETFTAQPGQFGNQAYVNKVLGHMAYFEQQLNVQPTVIPVSVPPPLTDAHHDTESQVGGHIGGPVTRPVGTRTQGTIARFIVWILDWWYKRRKLPH